VQTPDRTDVVQQTTQHLSCPAQDLVALAPEQITLHHNRKVLPELSV
jgi:hypothetical protein